jgi:excisionase family DNA binding protein
MITAQKPKTNLLDRGQSLAQTLTDEGRMNDAQTVSALLEALKPAARPEYLTTGEVARRIGISRQSVVNWVKKGWLDGVRLGGRIMIPANTLTDLDEILAVEALLNEDRPPATIEEINEALAPGRKDWTWIGKGK